MRSLRIEIAIAALILAPLLGYAIGYLFAGEPPSNARLGSAAATAGVAHDASLPRPAPGATGRLGV